MRRILTTPRGPWKTPLVAVEEALLAGAVEAAVRLMGVEEEVPLAEAVEAAWRQLRSRLPHLLLNLLLLPLGMALLRSSLVVESHPVAVAAVVEAEAQRPTRVPHWLPHLLVEVLPVAARTTRRLSKHPRRRPNRCSLRIRAPLEIGKLLRRVLGREVSLPPRHPHPRIPSLRSRIGPLHRRSSPDR
jgi:hypothetical protein